MQSLVLLVMMDCMKPVLSLSYQDLLTNNNNRGQRDGGLCDELAVNGEKQLLFTDEPVEFQEEQVEVQYFRRITDHFGGI